jgi:hypothetical protein
MSITEQTLNDIKKAQQDINKTVSVGTGLIAYDLQAPAKNLYPVLTPLRNKVARVPGNGGSATNWKAVTGLTGSGVASMPWVPEGQRSGRMSYQTALKAASYVTFGEEDALTFEAESAARGFEDIRATAAVRLLQQTMIKEEKGMLAGNASLTLAQPTAPTLAASGTTGTLPAATYSVIVAALTLEGYLAIGGSSATQLITSKTVTGADGNTYTLNGGVSRKSANATLAVTLGQILSATTPVVNGAVAYAWFVGTAGAETLQAITTINSATFSAALSSGNMAASSLSTTADYSNNASLAFDGFLTSAFLPANSAYVVNMATGTAGVGTPLTSGGRGNIVEIDNMLRTMWENFRLGVTVIYCSSQELTNITNKVMAAASGTILRYNSDNGSANEPYRINANGVITNYYNPYLPGGGRMIPIMIHPNLPAGTLFGWCEELPIYYQNNQVQNVAEMHMRRDYYQIDWPLRSRQYEMGVYAEGVLANYFPSSMAIITNIANG